MTDKTEEEVKDEFIAWAVSVMSEVVRDEVVRRFPPAAGIIEAARARPRIESVRAELDRAKKTIEALRAAIDRHSRRADEFRKQLSLERLAKVPAALVKMAGGRPTKEQVLMMVARAWSLRSTCPDLSVGCAVATEDGHVLATGYNGSPRGMPHCTAERLGGPSGSGERCAENGTESHRVVHAEANCVAQAARIGTSLRGATAFVTHFPCARCVTLLAQAGIERVVWDVSGSISAAETTRVEQVAWAAGIHMVCTTGLGSDRERARREALRGRRS